MIEDRDASRHNTCFFHAFVYLKDNGTAVDCIVRDISDTAARLQFPKPQVFPEFLDLHIPIKGQSFYAKVQWRDGDEVGVTFNAAPNLETADMSIDRRVDRLEAEIAALRQSIKHLKRDADQKAEVP